MTTKPLPASLAPISAAALVEQMVQTMSELSMALTAEAKALRERRKDELPELERCKRVLAASYEMQAGALLRLPEDDRLTPAMRDRLADAGLAMEKSLVDNLSALRAAKEVNERLMQMITEAAVNERPTGNGYNARGGAPASYGPKAMVRNPMPMTLNQQC